MPGHHHYIPLGLVAAVEGNQVRLSANAANAVQFEEEEGEHSASAPSSMRQTLVRPASNRAASRDEQSRD